MPHGNILYICSGELKLLPSHLNLCVLCLWMGRAFFTSRPFSLPLSVARWQNENAVIGIAQENNLSIFIVITAPVLNAH